MSDPAFIEREQLLAAYREEEGRRLSRGLIIGNLIGMFGMPSGVVLDYFLYPDKLPQFLTIRIAVDVILAVIVAALYLRRDTFRTPAIKVLGILSAFVFNFAFCLMIYLTNGATSPYCMALNLIITVWAVLLPWTVIETAVISAGSLIAYIIACVANPTFANPASYPLFAYNSSFIAITIFVCLGTTFFLSRARFQDFRLRHQLDVQNRELQDLDRVKTQFFSNVSHELRTPLTLILGPVESQLSRDDGLDARTHESLLLIHRNALRLLKLINDLLDLTRLDQGLEVLRKKPVQIDSFVRGIVESIRHLGLSKRLKIRVEGGRTDQEITMDPARMEKVLINLLTNAIKYTPAGGMIAVRWNRTEEEATVEVEDTGVGIPPEDLSKVFDRFHQVRGNAANQNQGVGIGLALAKELVGQHGGRIDVQSEVGRGTLFRIHLPAGEIGESSGAEAEKSRPEPASEEEPFEKAFRSADRSWRDNSELGVADLPVVGAGDHVVLVADDETDMRRYVVSLLTETYRVVQAANGSDVAGLVRKHRPGLVLLDWMMPGKDGLAVCRELREMPESHDLKILMLTARIDEKSKIEALQSGADDFLTKPFSSVEVKTRVTNLLRAGQLQKEMRGRNTELTETLEKLRRTESMLIQSEKMNAIGSLSAGLLHEINNPLNYTLTAISFARRMQNSLSEDVKEVLADVEEGMTRIRDVITHLKDFAYPEKPGAESIFPIEQAFSAARKLTADELDGIQIDVDFGDNVIVRGQNTQLTHVFINLLSNAAKAMAGRPPGARRAIAVKARAVDEMALVEFSDNGPGIPEDIINRIFEPFFTTRDVGKGMGMGLSICHTIMETHQGSIRVGNRGEGGAVFTLSLPLAAGALKLC